ncbi:hypothetical protein AVO44_11090 [Ruegeria profundi]|uniref:Uncharacterized protein n=1 Tax=Ruegeria profundi TaxID=1685378 RepID=A0A0X3TT53_9RHOB|nr:hypothetical protein AVO44_11090 [Ruegeria profundi]
MQAKARTGLRRIRKGAAHRAQRAFFAAGQSCGLTSRLTTRCTIGPNRRMTVKAIGQQKLHDAIQLPNVLGPNPIAFTVAIPVTIRDIRPDMIRLNTAREYWAGIITGVLLVEASTM